MLKNKKILVLVTAGVVALGYAVVSTNAFADTSGLTPTPVVSIPATPLASVTPPAIPDLSGVTAPLGIQAPSGLSSSPSTMPSIGDDDADDQSGDQSDDATFNGDDDGDNSSVGVSTSQSDDNGGDSHQNNDGQDGSGSDD